MVLTPIQRRNLDLFYLGARKALNNLVVGSRKYPHLRALYEKVFENLNRVPVNLYSGEALSSSGGWAVFGENIKKVSMVGGRPVLQSAIRLPKEHIFDESGRIRTNGALTLLHELSHVVLTPNEELFTLRVGLPGQYKDEFFADVLSSRIGERMGFTHDSIRSHLWRRRATFGGFPIERFVGEGVRGVREEIRKGRFVPRKPQRREGPLFPAVKREAPRGFFPKPKRIGEGPGIFPFPKRRI